MPFPIARWSSTKICESRKKKQPPNIKFSKTLSGLAEGSDSANGSTALHPDSVKVNQHMLHADASSAQSQQAQQQMASVKSKKSKTHKELQSTNSHRFLTNQPSVSNDDDVPIVHHGVVRRVASFTYSTDEKHGKQAGKKFNL